MAEAPIFDRVQETTATEGTDDYELTGAVGGYQSFAEALGGVLTVPYAAQYANSTDGSDWECGLGTFNGTDTLVRTTVTASSNGGDPVDWGAGTKRIFVTMTAHMVNRLRVDAESEADPLENGATLALGPGASATADKAIAIGENSSAAYIGSIAIGENSAATGSYTVSGVAIGQDSEAAAGVAIGHARIAGNDAIAIGSTTSSATTGDSSVTIGYNAQAAGSATIAIGNQAGGDGGNGVAIGTSAFVEESDSVAIGTNARSTKDGAVAIGDNTYAELCGGSYARGRRYNLREDAAFLEGTTNASTSSVNLLAVQYADEMSPAYLTFGLLYGYVYVMGTDDDADEYKIWNVEQPFTVSGGVVSLLGSPTPVEVYETAGATGWGLAIAVSSGILRVTGTNGSTNAQTWKAKLWVEGF